MEIKITEWWFGAWRTVSVKVIKVTKTMIVVQWGRGEQRFNRRHGHVTSHLSHGLSGMTDPFISHKELEQLEAALMAEG